MGSSGKRRVHGAHSKNIERGMKTFLAIFTITLIISGISNVEGGNQLGNLMKFLRNMKSKGWDKNLILAHKKTLKTSDNFKNVYIPKLDPANKHLILKESENPCKNGNTRFKEDCEKAAEVFRYLLDPVRL